ncbi:alpha-glucan family phosphorylase [Terrimonas sp. NA20]|uniref:Alpha-glucan family phosphorylase n=1 Tax=Terrimonas ginsenosidimutans TaxID=2908004 RepID=A0ABS9KVI7_9BACT|nr:alpha-glucan family phosphorylase [Terrimonas ginsenosidimutans]MCG2616292.1 alpha-glucan family phosphorylase [Terrimonas ginsenosidimutans]
MYTPFHFPYTTDSRYSKRVAYFCMEYAIHQPLKTYAGGLGYLAGSQMRGAFELKQAVVGIGILWKFGYYDQVRKQDQGMDVLFQEKSYGFLEKTNIQFSIRVSGHDVWVAAYYLPPDIFNTAPVFFLTTDIPENDYLSRTICHKLYDSNPETKIAAAILLGQGGAMLLEKINWLPEIYHLNESHGLPLAFYLYGKFGNMEDVRQRLVFTNHTCEPGGNEKTSLSLLARLGFFGSLNMAEVKSLLHPDNDLLDNTAVALQMAGISNGVSKLHEQALRKMKSLQDTDSLISITNAQDFTYWHDESMYQAIANDDNAALRERKKETKRLLFEEVADQTGEVYDPDVCTIVFARRFAGYKRAELLLSDMDRFKRIISNATRPVQLIWAGKPYPMDFPAISLFNRIVEICKTYTNCSVLVGYEMKLSKLLKAGADIWLNIPRMGHEASGTSGMSAAMNGALNVSMPDGWFPEFAQDKINCFVIPPADSTLQDHEQDEKEASVLYDLLEKEIISLYYDAPGQWMNMVKNGMRDVLPFFDSRRMMGEYYSRLYSHQKMIFAI